METVEPKRGLGMRWAELMKWARLREAGGVALGFSGRKKSATFYPCKPTKVERINCNLQSWT